MHLGHLWLRCTFSQFCIYFLVILSRPYICDLYTPTYARQTQKPYQSVGISQVLLCLFQSSEQLSFCKGRVDWFDMIYSWKIYVGSFNHLNILKMLIHWLFNSLSNIASDTELGYGLIPPFHDRYYADSSAVFWILFHPPQVVKGSSSALGIGFGHSLSA